MPLRPPIPNTNEQKRRRDGIGKRANATTQTAQRTQTQPPTTQTPAQATNQKTKIRIIELKTTMFGDKKQKPNRRFTPWEFQEELEISKLFGRPPRTYFYDTPYYPFFPPTPIANFDLKFKE